MADARSPTYATELQQTRWI